MLTADLRYELESVSDYPYFLRVDELHDVFWRLGRRYSDVCTVSELGTARNGEPLLRLTVGDSDQHAVVFAYGHPDEPVGGLTAAHLATRLCTDTQLRRRTGYTWHIVPCVDPSGARKNEVWLRGPRTLANYTRHYFRWPAVEEVEWSFPLRYKDANFVDMSRETEAVKTLIDDTRPIFLSSLHNGEAGGVYYYAPAGMNALYPLLGQIAAEFGQPLKTGEPESPFMTRLQPGVYQTYGAADEYDYCEQTGATWSDHGDSSWGYASERYGTRCVIPEVRLWVDPRGDNDRPCGMSYAGALSKQASMLAEFGNQMQNALTDVDEHALAASRLLRSAHWHAELTSAVAAESARRADLDHSRRPATIAEKHEIDDAVHRLRLRIGGMFNRGLDEELAKGTRAQYTAGTVPMQRLRDEFAPTFTRWCAEAETYNRAGGARPVAIRSAVAIQYGAILATGGEVRRANAGGYSPTHGLSRRRPARSREESRDRSTRPPRDNHEPRVM